MDPIRYCRHPFVYLLEAADDITYNIIDFEDAHRLGILESQLVETSFYDLIKCINRTEDDFTEIEKKLKVLTNENERIAYLRSRSINSLILEANDVFADNIPLILEGKFNDTLVENISNHCSALSQIMEISKKRIYNDHKVVEIELAGYNVMYELLDITIPAVISKKNQRDKRDKKIIELIPNQFGDFSDENTVYEKCLGVLDFVSGMTDLYATELYRKIKGIEIGKHS